MKKRFLGIICLLYSGIILYAWISNNLKNFLAPNMQIYLKISLIPLIIMGFIMLFDKRVHYKFKVSDLVLIIPLIMIIFASDGKLTLTFADNRIANYNTEKTSTDDYVEEVEETDENTETYDLSSIDFDVIDSTYDILGNYITYEKSASKFEGKTIRVRGFSVTKATYLQKGYFAIGKYLISCCAADAEFVGFIAKYDISKIKNNTWYEIEGVLQKGKDNEKYDIMYVKVINIKEIDSKDEEQYVYPCYSYDDGLCLEVRKYGLN